MTKQPLTTPTRRILQGASVLVGLGLLALPLVTVLLSETASADGLWTALRIIALEAFSVLFVNIITGSFRPFFNRLVRPRTVQRVHTATGITGFSLAVAHGVCALVFGIAGYRPGALWVGPAVLALVAVSIAAALLRTRLKRYWRWVHRLNYAFFFAILLHGLVLGTDLRSELVLKIGVGAAGAIVLAGAVRRGAASMAAKR